MGGKECGHDYCDRRRRQRRILGALVALLILILFIIFLVWAILRPEKPKFILQDVTVYSFNVSAQPDNQLSATLQVTITTQNRMDRVGIYYEKLDVYASYHNQQITLPTVLPSTYQGHKGVAIWSPFLYGDSVPVAPYLATSVREDQNAGMVLVNIKMGGRVKWKVGTWMSGRYHIWINCPAYITFGGSGNKGVSSTTVVGDHAAAGIKYQLVTGCQVDV